MLLRPKTYGAENASFTPSKRPIWSEVVRLGAVAAVLDWPMGPLGTKANPQTGDAAEAARAQAAVVTVFFILFWQLLVREEKYSRGILNKMSEGMNQLELAVCGGLGCSSAVSNGADDVRALTGRTMVVAHAQSNDAAARNDVFFGSSESIITKPGRIIDLGNIHV